MRNIIHSLLQHPLVVKTRQAISRVTAPVAQVWRTVWAPVAQLLSPLTERWLTLTEPIRRQWAEFKKTNPIGGKILGATGTAMKWGVYTLFTLIFLVWLGAFGHMPNRAELKILETANATEIYTSDSILIGKYFIENRTEIGLDKISPYIVTALLATEDKRFFEHSGIDLMSWLRAFKGLATNEDGSGGGSTLSQQLAKNLYPREEHFYIKVFGKTLRIPFLSRALSLLANKIRENIISIRIEKVYNKEEILNLYLNTVNFGGTRFGINVASKYYYNKKARELAPDQAATLIGMLKATTALDPVRNPNDSKARRDLVMRRMVQNQNFEFNSEEFPTVAKMVQNGRLSQKQYDELSKKPVGAKRYGGDDNNVGVGTYFREYLRTEVMPEILKDLKKEDGGTYDLYRDGLKIYTTLNSRMQQYAEESVQKQMESLQKKFVQHWKNVKGEKPWGADSLIEQQVRRSERWERLKDGGMSDSEAMANFSQPVKMTIFSWQNGGGDADTTMTPIDSVRYYFTMLNCGFMAMDHKNGYIRAWVGGTNFKYFKYDHNLSRRQVGSTFKPIVYAAALQDSVKPCQWFRNELTTIEDWTPHNADESYGGWCSTIGGLTHSVNVIAAQLIKKAGIQNTLDLSAKMGVTSKLPREFGISLGACDVSLYDMMKVYGTMANQGKRPEPVAVLKVVDRKGEVIYDYKKALSENPKLGAHVEAMTPQQAATMTRMLQSVIDYGTGRKLRYGFGIQGDFAGKTGTTQNQADGWFITYNPTLVTGSWVGGPSRAVRFRSMDLGQGSAMALPIVATFWHKVANDRKLMHLLSEKFDVAPEIQAQCGCPFRISISPDTLNLLMQDSTLRDSLRANGYKNLKEIAQQKFGQPIPDEPGGGEIDPDKYYDEQAPEDKKDDKDKRNKPRDVFNKLIGRDPKEKEKKNN